MLLGVSPRSIECADHPACKHRHIVLLVSIKSPSNSLFLCSKCHWSCPVFATAAPGLVSDLWLVGVCQLALDVSQPCARLDCLRQERWYAVVWLRVGGLIISLLIAAGRQEGEVVRGDCICLFRVPGHLVQCPWYALAVYVPLLVGFWPCCCEAVWW